METEEFKTTFSNFVKLIKMAAAVAKAQEKNRVPESPQVLRLFLTQDTQRETTPLSLSYRDWSATILSLSRTRYWQDFLGIRGGEDDKQKTKPKYRTVSKFSKPFQTTCLGVGKKDHRAPTSDLESNEVKVSMEAVLFFSGPKTMEL